MIAEKAWMRKKNHKQTGRQKLATTTIIKEPPFTEKQRSRTQRRNEASTFYQGKPKNKQISLAFTIASTRTQSQSISLSLSLSLSIDSPSHKSPIKTTIHETKEGPNRPKKQNKNKNKTKASWWWSVAAEDAPKAPGI
jgi:hypothetical protein